MKKTVLITGVNRGLGKFLYLKLNGEYNVFGTTRLYEDKFFYLEMLNPNLFEKNIEEIFKSVDPDILIHNIGVGALGSFSDFSEKQIKNIFEINTFNAYKFINLYKERKKIINTHQKPYLIIVILSDVLKKPYPYLSVYTASKKSLEILLTSLKLLEKINIEFIYPGPIENLDNLFYPTILTGELKPFNSYALLEDLNLKFSSPYQVLESVKEKIEPLNS